MFFPNKPRAGRCRRVAYAHERSVLALAVCLSALADLADELQTNPPPDDAPGQPCRHDAAGMAFTLELYLSMLDCQLPRMATFAEGILTDLARIGLPIREEVADRLRVFFMDPAEAAHNLTRRPAKVSPAA